ncbi:MAG: hypothetical protein IT323_04875 [Anaerolineae bacterium]|nr:hypothetical protein [Anaerolineae bacterium]
MLTAMRAPTDRHPSDAAPAHRWLLLGVVLLAAIFRLQNLFAIEHNVDHAYPVWQALMTLDRGFLPITAQGTSVLFANPALTGYLFVLPVALTRSPVGPYVLVIALNTLAVWLAYRAARQLGSPRAALIAAFLLAVNPWAVEYSRTTWVQALMPFFACLVFWLWLPVWLGTARRPARRTLIAMLAVAAMAQTYLLGFAILAPVGLLALVFHRRIPWKALALGAALFAAITALYAAGLINQGDQTLARIQEFAGGQSRLSGEALSHAARLVTGRDYAAARGLDAPIQDAAARQALSEVVNVVLALALVVGVAKALIPGPSSAEGRGKYTGLNPDGVILLVWFTLPVALMSYVSRPVHPFYLLLTLPAGHVLAGLGGDAALQLTRARRWASVGMLAACGALIALIAGLNVWRYAEETLAQPGAHGLTALPLGVGVDMLATLLPGPRAPDQAVYADIEDWILNSFAGRLFPVIRDTNTAHTTTIPASGGVYLFFAAPGAPPQPPRGPADEMRYALADGSAVIRFTVAVRAIERCTGSAPTAIQSDVGIRFLGYRIEQPLVAGREAVLCTAWRVESLPPGRFEWLYAPFVHVFDASGARVAIGDGASTPGALWRQGDVQLKTIRVTLPGDAAGPFTLRFGLYDGVHGHGATFTLPDGGQSPDIPGDVVAPAP